MSGAEDMLADHFEGIPRSDPVAIREAMARAVAIASSVMPRSAEDFDLLPMERYVPVGGTYKVTIPDGDAA